MATNFPIQIVYQKLGSSKALEQYIKSQTLKLSQYFHHILACRVLIEIANRHPSQGKIFHVCVDLNVPNKKLVVSRCSHKNHAHEDAFVTIRDAFSALKHRLTNYVQKQSGRVKHHAVPAHGRVIQILPEGDHGFIESSDGRTIYFTKNSVVNGGFEKLDVGKEVRFVETTANPTGRLTASTVKLINKHHLAA